MSSVANKEKLATFDSQIKGLKIGGMLDSRYPEVWVDSKNSDVQIGSAFTICFLGTSEQIPTQKKTSHDISFSESLIQIHYLINFKAPKQKLSTFLFFRLFIFLLTTFFFSLFQLFFSCRLQLFFFSQHCFHF